MESCKNLFNLVPGAQNSYLKALLSNTANTVLLEAYEKSRPAKKPNRPTRMEPQLFLVQILDFDNTKDVRKF